MQVIRCLRMTYEVGQGSAESSTRPDDDLVSMARALTVSLISAFMIALVTGVSLLNLTEELLLLYRIVLW